MQSRPPIRRLIQLAIVVIATVCLSVPASAEILKVVVNDTIQPISEEYIARAIDEAGHRNDQAILIEINTPGGLVSSTREIIENITASAVPVIIYVTPSGGHAGIRGILHSGIRRHRRYGSRHQHRRRSSRTSIGRCRSRRMTK